MDIRGLINRAGLGRAVVLFGLLAGLFAMHGMAANHDTFALLVHGAATGHADPMVHPVDSPPRSGQAVALGLGPKAASAGPAVATGTAPAAMEHRRLPSPAAATTATAQPDLPWAPDMAVRSDVVSPSSGDDGAGDHAQASMETCLGILVGLGALVFLVMLTRARGWSAPGAPCGGGRACLANAAGVRRL